jgi:hypothetical protein
MRVRLRSRVALAALIATEVLACSTDPVEDAACTPGTTRQGTVCVPAPGSDGGSDATAEGGTPPRFSGISAVAPASTTALFVTWPPAEDAATPPARMKYALFAARSAEALNFSAPAATSPAGASSFVLGNLAPSTRWFVAVRAVDEAGLSDDNTVTQSAETVADGVAPQFGGVKTAEPGGSGAVVLGWEAAVDELTPAGAMTYVVYGALAPALPDLGATPILVTQPGALSAIATGLSDPTASYTFLVRARDAAGNVDTNVVTTMARPGIDTVAPQFEGCKTATATSAGSALVTWAPASDDTTPASRMRYEIFVSKTAGVFDFNAPAATVAADSSTTVLNLTPNTTWHFVCRARDASGNRDLNLVDRTATTSQDASPPTFAGSNSAGVDPVARTALFTWTAATDDQTPPSQIVYDVFEATFPGGESFAGKPRATSPPGATSFLLTDLTPDATLYWVVRARDLGGNRDANTSESTGTTLLSFRRSIQPIFTTNCAVVGCHVPGDPASGLSLAQGFAHAELLNVPAAQYPSFVRVLPGDPDASYLYLKIAKNPPPYGWQMPAPATGGVLTETEKTTVKRWILQGALNN